MKNIALVNDSRFDVMSARRDFPVLARMIRGKPLAYLDNGASAQRPTAVIDAVDDYERRHHANIHRGVHTLSQEATGLYEAARDKVLAFLHAASRHEVIFVRGTTEAINLVAQSYLRPILKTGDEILITHLEHHANIVPWQMVCEQTGATLKVAPMDEHGEVHVEAVEALMSERTRLFACAHVSNALGTVLPVRRLVAAAKARGITTLIDGAQAVPHMAVDVQDLGCDFYAFSGHKLFGPTGIGILYGRESLLERMPPWQGGGDMILTVTFGKTTYNALPYKFEAGTPNISGAIGLGAAIDYLSAMDREGAHAHERALLAYASETLSKIEGLRAVGTARDKASLVSFVVADVHPHDLGTILDEDGIAVRTGHHCAMPVMEYFKLPATARASFAFYNTFEEIDRLNSGIRRALSMFARA
ncbi:MAG: cysteine desulfurase / selenocysteine lyase [Gammaproteobacteria bacterium]|jgi:cysteine desulfurase/selenocysteine lyase|nr:cysteine desulfurase / selenocysteine lyase [Gammaproteobacteria bacterium]